MQTVFQVHHLQVADVDLFPNDTFIYVNLGSLELICATVTTKAIPVSTYKLLEMIITESPFLKTSDS